MPGRAALASLDRGALEANPGTVWEVEHLLAAFQAMGASRDSPAKFTVPGGPNYNLYRIDDDHMIGEKVVEEDAFNSASTAYLGLVRVKDGQPNEKQADQSLTEPFTDSPKR